MPRTAPAKKTRGTPVPLPSWFLEAAIKHTEGWSLDRLALALTQAVTRDPPWDRTTVGKFLKNQHPTTEMMEAFCALFEELIQPVFVAKDPAEAYALLVASRRARGVGANPEKVTRRAQLNQLREGLEESVKDQTERLESKDERARIRRRPRGVARGRSSA